MRCDVRLRTASGWRRTGNPSGPARLLRGAWPFLVVLLCTGLASADPPSWQREIGHEGRLIRKVPALGPELQTGGGAVSGSEREDAGDLAGAPLSRDEWTLRLSAANRVFQDIDFPNATTGFAAGELGIVYRTTDGGAHWQQIMNLGFPYYWYGVDAVSPQDVIISGFQNQTGEGIVRWSHDGGNTWGPVLAAHPTAWLDRIRFGDAQHGLATTIGGGQVAYTDNGGETAADWSRSTADPSGGWFAGSFTFLSDLHVFITGIRFCRSSDGGISWRDLPSADPVFDGATEFLDSRLGYTGGGSISPEVQGWIHRTTNGGDTWSGRLVVTPYPVRTLRFGSTQRGWAAGGNIYGGGGGIYGSTDGGQTWAVELNTGAEMRGLALARVSPDSVDVWCCGYTTSFQGRIYQRRVFLPENPASVRMSEARDVSVVRSFPNPFNPATTLTFSIAHPESILVEIFDPAGRVIRRIRPGFLGSGTHQLRWDGRDEQGTRLASGVFYYRLQAGQSVLGGTLVLVR